MFNAEPIECKRKLVSVVVPMKDTAEYVKESLDSLKRQTHANFEAIVVDDGSVDGSSSIAEQYAKSDNRFTYVRLDQSHGVSHARNVGLRHVHGDIICFMDSDDKFKPQAFEKISRMFKKNNPNVLVFGADIVGVKQPPKWMVRSLSPRDSVTYYGAGNADLMFKEATRQFSWRVAINRRAFEEYRVKYDEDLAVGEDLLFLFELYLKSTKTMLSSDKLYKYRAYRSGSAMDVNLDQSCKEAQDHVLILSKVFDLFSRLRKESMTCELMKALMPWTDKFVLQKVIDLDDAVTRQRLLERLSELYDDFNDNIRLDLRGRTNCPTVGSLPRQYAIRCRELAERC